MGRPIKVKAIQTSRSGRYVLRWRQEGRWRQQLTDIEAKPRNRKKAERAAAALEATLREEQRHGGRMPWMRFQEIYTRDKLSTESRAYHKSMLSVLRAFEQLVRVPEFLDDIGPLDLSQFVSELNRSGKRQTTISTYLKHLNAALGWAADNHLIAERPQIRTKRDGRRSGMRSRPITAEEFDRMLAAVEKVRPSDTTRWQEYLTGLWWSGLRLAESIDLSWDWRDSFSVDLEASYPCFRILSESEKGRSDRVLPLAPQFAEILTAVPRVKRCGKVFRLGCSADRAGKVIAEIGAAAGVIVNHRGKTATAHDLRRSFATRWAKVLAPAELQQLMRHRSIETTMSFYVHLDMDDLGAKLWRKGDQLGGQTQITNDPGCQRTRQNHAE